MLNAYCISESLKPNFIFVDYLFKEKSKHSVMQHKTDRWNRMREVSIAEQVLLETLKHIYAELVVANLTSIK